MCIDIDRDAFAGLAASLARSHTRELVSVAGAAGLAAEDALDAVQEAFHTFLRMPQARSLLEEPDEARALLRVLVRNVARNLRRRHHRSKVHEELGSVAGVESDAPSVEVLLEQAERHVQLAGCMRRLDDVQRSIVNLRVLEEMSGVDVARTLELTPGHVAVLLHRAKKNLMECMIESAV